MNSEELLILDDCLWDSSTSLKKEQIKHMFTNGRHHLAFSWEPHYQFHISKVQHPPHATTAEASEYRIPRGPVGPVGPVAPVAPVGPVG